MPKYLLLKHYRGPDPYRPVPPMDQWAPEDVDAHMTFLREVSRMLEERGEYVGAEALTPTQTWVRYGGPGAALVVTDGPHPETSDLVAGWYMIDVDSYERALEVAAYVSSEPGPGGEPLYEWIDVRGDGLIMRAAVRSDDVARAVRLAPQVLAELVRRREDFAAAEDAVQDATVEALRVWPDHPPRDQRRWLTTVATRRLVDARRSEAARRRREETTALAPVPGVTEQGDDTLLLLFWCCHPEPSPASQVALTLRAVGGLSTREIADVLFVPETTMAQRISRAKRTLRGRRFAEPGDLAVASRPVARVPRRARPAERPGRRGDSAHSSAPPGHHGAGGAGLLALLLLQHARLPARTDADGGFVPLDEQDRSRWDTSEIAEAVAILQGALGEQRRGRYQILAAIAALHADAMTAEKTDWPQILEWYDELVALSGDPDREDPPRC